MASLATTSTSPSAVHEKSQRDRHYRHTDLCRCPGGGVGYIGWNLVRDLSELRTGSALPYLLLHIALFVALGFEFLNGFHDTANAVATVIDTHSLDPHIAATGSGVFNFLGVVYVHGRGGGPLPSPRPQGIGSLSRAGMHRLRGRAHA